MRLKKLVVIPILIIVYLFFVDILVQYNPPMGNAPEKSAGATEAIGVGTSVTVSVTRPYFFGLIRLPIYNSVLGDISGFHTIFFNSMWILTAAFIGIEIFRLRRGSKSIKGWKKY